MSELSAEQITACLQDLPKQIFNQESECGGLREKADMAQLDFDREFAQAFEIAKAQDRTDTDAKFKATLATEKWKVAQIMANSRLNAALVLLKKLNNEFTSVRKQASIRNEEHFQARSQR